ncbi:hypothetical protein [uncultured Hyphomicrobium sp.]|jgi:hypothetical protein|uniref:hypothetical protein n=1 Tax=uncultured Hyphomicrobium sp. TaxID=194373 RepID=UPI0025F113E9|nr:hypothetical protein [uncultured Hyphomicrobium sp.]
MKARPIEQVQEGGRLVAKVQLGRDPSLKAEIYQDDLEFLEKLGLSLNWTALKMSGAIYVTANAKNTAGGKVLVARVLLDAGPGQMIRYADKNPLNLRRENLRIVTSAKAIQRARDSIRTTTI